MQVFVIGALRSDDYTTEAYIFIWTKLAAIRENDLGIISIPYIGLGILVLLIMLIILFTKMPNTADQEKCQSESFKSFCES